MADPKTKPSVVQDPQAEASKVLLAFSHNQGGPKRPDYGNATQAAAILASVKTRTFGPAYDK